MSTLRLEATIFDFDFPVTGCLFMIVCFSAAILILIAVFEIKLHYMDYAGFEDHESRRDRVKNEYMYVQMYMQRIVMLGYFPLLIPLFLRASQLMCCVSSYGILIS